MPSDKYHILLIFETYFDKNHGTYFTKKTGENKRSRVITDLQQEKENIRLTSVPKLCIFFDQKVLGHSHMLGFAHEADRKSATPCV